eukprot:gene4003-20147_t
MSLHLQQAEEDRNIAWQLIERLMATINIKNDEIEELQDKREALNRASKRLEKKTTRLELRQKKARIFMEERLHATESHEAQAMAVNSMMRKIAGKVHRRETMESNQSGYRFTGIHLYLKGDHYEAAVRLLKDRYGHKIVLRKAHFDGLEKLPVVNNSYELQRLKRFYEEVECHYKALSPINVRPEEYSTTMVPKILGKLPMDICIELTEGQEENEDVEMAGLVEGLRKCIKVMDKCGIQERPFPQQKKPWNGSPPQMEDYSNDHTSSTGATLTLADHQKRNKCEFCLGNHKAVKCESMKQHTIEKQ